MGPPLDVLAQRPRGWRRRRGAAALPRLSVLWLSAPTCAADVLVARGLAGERPLECEAMHASWNQEIEDGGSAALAGALHFDAANPGGCLGYAGERARGRLVLVDAAEACDELVVVCERAAEGGASGVVFFYHQEGLDAISLGNHSAPPVRAVMIARDHGEALREALGSREVTAELLRGRVISADAYEEQFILRADEISSTRATNFMWHVYPEMLRSQQRVPFSLQLMRKGIRAPSGWFKSPPDFVPLFNPSLIALEDGSLLATMRMSNGPGCPSVRHARESSMDTRIFLNALVLVHINPVDLEVLSHTMVEMPELACQFTSETKMSGRRFLDQVRGPMDARLVQGSDGEMWLSFYAERNVPGSDEIVRGMNAAPLHVEWAQCPEEEHAWQLRGRDEALVGAGCRWLGMGDGRSGDACRASCEASSSHCNAVSLGPGRCELRRCEPEVEVATQAGWETWLHEGLLQWHRAAQPCTTFAMGSGLSLRECQRSCEAADDCSAVLFSPRFESCALQRCDGLAGRPGGAPGWEAWRLGPPPPQQCLRRAWVEPTELLTFPTVNGVEKNWNLIKAERDRLVIEYFVEPHIVLEAGLDRSSGVALTSLAEHAVSRWPYDVLHGVSNVRGGYCCLELPQRLWPDWYFAAGGPGPMLLGCGHLQRIRSPFDQAKGDLTRFRRQDKTRAYHNFFYVVRGSSPFEVMAVSTEWCITMNGHFSSHWRQEFADGEEACEAIQFASGIALRGADELVVAYGINDCESDLLSLPVARVLEMLRPVQSTLNVSLDELEMI